MEDKTKNKKKSTEEQFNMLDLKYEEEPYSYWEHRDLTHPLTSMGALVHMIKGSVGSGILSMPVAFKNGGLWTSLIGAIIVGVIYGHCISIVVYSAQVLCVRLKRPQLEFAEIAEVAFQSGHAKLKKFTTLAKIIIDGSLFVAWYSTCMVYVVFIASSLKQVLEHNFDISMDIHFYILITVAFVLPIGLIRNLKFLVPFSFFALCGLTFSCGFVFFEILQDLPPVLSRPAFKGFHSLPLFVTTVLFAFDGIGVVFPIENNMKNPRRFLGCPGVLNISIIWLITMYSAMGFFGYLRYGEGTLGTITLNISTSSVLGQAVKLFVSFNVLCSYALFLYVPVGVVWQKMEPKIKDSKKSMYHTLLRIVLVLGSVMVAALVPDLEPFVGLVGAIGSSTLILFFPPIIETVTFWENKAYMGIFRWRLYKNILLLLMWIVTLVTGTHTSLVAIVDLYKNRQ